VSRLVFIHGIGQQNADPDTLRNVWAAALREGIRHAGRDFEIRDHDIAMVFYGDVFKTRGSRGPGTPDLDVEDLEDELERELLLQWWAAAATTDPSVPGPDAATRLRTPRMLQRALDALSQSEFFAGIAERALIFSLRQVRLYLTHQQTRNRILERAGEAINDGTRVVVAHSLGTIVAYESLFMQPLSADGAFVTLGSPLGIRNLIFDRLRPAPVDGQGAWPPSVNRWTNLCDYGDVVALVKELRPLFPFPLVSDSKSSVSTGAGVADGLVHNGAKAHDVRPYLRAAATGRAVADALA
jgi:hypothetical protein